MSAQQIHEIGLKEVERLKNSIVEILKIEGFKVDKNNIGKY